MTPERFVNTYQALNIVAKWRAFFAGWQLGTRPKGDPECDAVRDHREATLMLRVETTALVGLLIKKGVFTDEEFDKALGDEAVVYNRTLEQRYPGITAHEHGLTLDERAAETMKGWKP